MTDSFFARQLNMKTCNVVQRVSLGFAAILQSLVFSMSAGAASIEVTAMFKPDPSNPMRNEFTNTTPFTGHCASYPTFCEGLSIFSILVPIDFSSIAPIEASHSDMRKGAMFRPPTDWRPLLVTHQETGEQSTLQVRIASIGARYYLPDRVQNIIGEGAPVNNSIAHEMLWGGYNWTFPPGPCAFTGGMYVEPAWRSFFWLTPLGSLCAPTAAYRIESLRYDMLQIGYELRTPNPLEMSTGRYVGGYTYGVGPGRDFDMGDIMLPSDDSLTINFTLDVQHTLKVDIPPGGEKIQMIAQGGWQNWLHSGRKPVRIFRDQTFHISASSRFKMFLDCQFGPGTSCYINDGNNIFVPIVVSVSLPAGLMDSSGNPVRQQLLKVGEANGVVFQPSQYVDRQNGTLHFELHKDAIEIVLAPTTPKHYSGTVVVIWDSEV
ncbi:hypothetical protein ACPCYX_10745 [Pseudomonas fluorescens]|uniref:hypothetical protein n=1 Tax=Pseudomonas fluorescens TaxID=294 RepID=UPI003C223CEA